MTCSKIRFPTRAAAKAHERDRQARHGGAKLRPYECAGCGTWHLTTGAGKLGKKKGGSRGIKAPEQGIGQFVAYRDRDHYDRWRDMRLEDWMDHE